MRTKISSLYEHLRTIDKEQLYGILAKLNALTPFGVLVRFLRALMTPSKQTFFIKMQEKLKRGREPLPCVIKKSMKPISKGKKAKLSGTKILSEKYVGEPSVSDLSEKVGKCLVKDEVAMKAITK